MRKLDGKIPDRRSSLTSRLSDIPLAAVACAFSLGIALSLLCTNYSFAGIVASDLCTIAAALLALRRNRLLLSFILGIAAIATSGLLMAFAHRDGFPNFDLRNLISGQRFLLGEPVSSEGCVVKESEMRGDESVATIELLAFLQRDHWIPSKGKAIVRIAVPENSNRQEFKLIRGDRVRAWVIWNLPRNFENPGSADSAGLLMRRGIFLTGKVRSFRLLETIPSGCVDPWTHLANIVGKRVRQSLEPLRAAEKGQRAAILASLIIGDYSSLDNNTRQVFQNSGTFHVLVISGLHVAWITGLLLQLLKVLYLPERTRYFLAFLIILLYTCVVGFQASISRCLWMFLLYLVGLMLFRKAEAVNVLLGSAIVLLLIQPTWLFETGFQLSFLSVLAIALTAGPAIRNYLNPVCRPLLFSGRADRLFLQPGACHKLGRRLRIRCEIRIEEITDSSSPIVSRVLVLACRGVGWAGLALGSVIVTSLAVQIWLQPLLAYYFNRMSWISPIANVVIVPLSSAVLGIGTAAALAANVHWLGPLLMRLAGSLASLLLSCAASMSDIPGAWQRCPTPSPAWVVAGILLLFAWGFFEWRRIWIAFSAVAIMLACLSYGAVPVLGQFLEEVRYCFRDRTIDIWNRDAPILSITCLDVGEGDSIVIRFPDTRVWVLDAGGLHIQSREDSAYAFDIGEAVVSRYLWHFWVRRIDQVLISHPDMDHAGGIPAVMRNFPVDRFRYGRAGTDPMLAELSGVAGERRIPTQQLLGGMEEWIGRVKLQVLNPPSGVPLSTTNENSLVFRLSFGRFAAFLAGDLEKSGEATVLLHPGPLYSQLLKVAHHGSRSGTSNSFLDRTRARWAILSVGRNNPFGHPSKETVNRLLQHGALPISTVNEGAITLETDGKSYLLKTHVSGLLERGEL